METCSYETPKNRASGYNLWWWDETVLLRIEQELLNLFTFFSQIFQIWGVPFWACWELQNIYVLFDKLFHSIIWTVKKYGLLCTRKMHCPFFFKSLKLLYNAFFFQDDVIMRGWWCLFLAICLMAFVGTIKLWIFNALNLTSWTKLCCSFAFLFLTSILRM